MTRVLVTDHLQDIGVDALRREGLVVDAVPPLPEDQLCERIGGYEGLIVRSATKVTARVIEAGRSLKVVGRAGTGVDNIDVDAASRRGIIVMNTPGANTIAAAEHTVALLLNLARKIPQAHAALHERKWERERFVGVEVYGKTLGVIGLGRIGTEVGRRALGLRMQVIAYDPYLPAEVAQRLGVELVELPDLFRRADFITVHTPLTAETRNFIGAEELAQMKDGVRLINCARGGVINEEALAAAIRSGASAIVTSNLADFPTQALAPFQIEPKHPDDFVTELIDSAPAVVLAAVTRQAAELRSPPRSVSDLFETLQSVGLPMSVARLRELFGS